MPSQAPDSATTAIADLGPLCPADFKVTAGAAGVYEEVIRFAVPSYMGDLFRNMSLKGMFRSVEANATKVWVLAYRTCLCFFGRDTSLRVDTNVVAHAGG